MFWGEPPLTFRDIKICYKPILIRYENEWYEYTYKISSKSVKPIRRSINIKIVTQEFYISDFPDVKTQGKFLTECYYQFIVVVASESNSYDIFLIFNRLSQVGVSYVAWACI